MTVVSFLKLVEIQTKVASVIPFSLGTLYALYHFDSFKIENFLLMLLSLIAFDMATTAINNYYDYKRAVKKHGYNYEFHNAIVSYQMKETTVRMVIFALVGFASLLGIILVLNTNIIILLLGMVSFAVGILYSFGPVPISRTPLGELFSGLFMGFIITFIAAYIHVYDQTIVALIYSSGQLNFSINLWEVIYLFIFSISPISGIANIMLANNICDIEDDLENKRFTLPIYLGKPWALWLFKVLYYLSYISIILLVILKVMPPILLLSLITLIPVKANIGAFNKIQIKKDTFVLAVKNFILINMSLILLLGIVNLFYR